LILSVVNNQSMALHLSEISHHIPAGRHEVVVVDRAAWHMSPKVTGFKNISLLPLPAASPELNPQAQVMKGLLITRPIRDKELFIKH
jgi:hypothetical protein